MGSDEQVFSLCIHHFPKVLLVDGYQSLLDKPVELCVIVNDSSQRVEASTLVSGLMSLLEKLLGSGNRLDDSCAES